MNRNILEALCNQADFTDRLGPLKLSDIDWRVLKSSKDFLEAAYNCTKAASGRNYATLAMQPLIYTHLKNLCLSTISGATSTGFTTPTVKIAAASMLEKLEKYCDNLTSETANIALFLDPRGSSAGTSDDVKVMVRTILFDQYDYSPSQENSGNSNEFDLFHNAEANDVTSDEIEEFSLMTLKPDRSCVCPVSWWKQQSGRFPKLSLLARDTLMIMGSSVASESAFSDSGDFVCADRSLLSDENISILMKLRSWNRLGGKFM